MAQSGATVFTVYHHALPPHVGVAVSSLEGPRWRTQLLTVTGMGVSCTFGPGALDGLLEGSRCCSPRSWSCSQFACRTRWFGVPLETKPRETEGLALYTPGKAMLMEERPGVSFDQLVI